MRRSVLRYPSGSVVSAASLVAALLLAGCATDQPPRKSTAELDGAPGEAPEDIDALLAAQARALENAARGAGVPMSRDGQPVKPRRSDASLASTPAGESVPPGEADPASANSDEVVSIDQPAGDADIVRGITPEPPSAPVSAPSADEERLRLTSELAAILRREADSSSTPMVPLTQLAALDLIEPGTFNSVYGRVGGADALGQGERAFLREFAAMMGEAGSALRGGGDPAEVASRLGASGDAIRAHGALGIPTAAVCTRVEGFGSYTELPRGGDEKAVQLIAGRRHQMIAYAEVENFAVTRTGGGESPMHRVDLNFELALYHMGKETDLLAWRTAPQRVSDESRRARRDFHIIQRIELPETLTVDRYVLKVTVRDTATGAEAQSTIPIEVVADRSALGRR